MSSSNIIRGDLHSSPIVPIEFRRIDGELPKGEEPVTTPSFVPVDFSSRDRQTTPSEPEPEGASPTAAESAQQFPPPGIVMIPEGELQSRLEAAYLRGKDEGKELAERGLANVFRAMRQSVTELAGLRERILRESEEDLLKLSIVIARKIIQKEISADPGILSSLVAAAISDSISLDRITIRLNPADYEMVNRDRDRYLGALSPETRVILSSDETLSPGDCVVDSVTGVMDARIETQLEEIYRKFADERGIVSIESSDTMSTSQLVDDA